MRYLSELTADRSDPAAAPVSTERSLREAANWPPAPDEDVYVLRRFPASGAGRGMERVAVCSDELAISEAFRRLRAGLAIDIWRGERWVGRCERVADQSAPAARPPGSDRRRGAASGWTTPRTEQPAQSAC